MLKMPRQCQVNGLSVLTSILVVAQAVNAIDVSFTGLTLTLSNIPYYVPPRPVGKTSGNLHNSTAGDFDLLPITVVEARQKDIRKDDLKDIVANFSNIDDVYQDTFLQGKATVHPWFAKLSCRLRLTD